MVATTVVLCWLTHKPGQPLGGNITTDMVIVDDLTEVLCEIFRTLRLGSNEFQLFQDWLQNKQFCLLALQQLLNPITDIKLIFDSIKNEVSVQDDLKKVTKKALWELLGQRVDFRRFWLTLYGSTIPKTSWKNFRFFLTCFARRTLILRMEVAQYQIVGNEWTDCVLFARRKLSNCVCSLFHCYERFLSGDCCIRRLSVWNVFEQK